MKNRILALCSLGTIAACQLTAAKPDGVIGQGLLATQAGYVWSDEDDGDISAGVLGVLWQDNVLRSGIHGVDLRANASYIGGESGDDEEVEGWNAAVGFNYFLDFKGPVTPFVTGGMGYMSASSGSVDEDGYTYNFGGGVEVYVAPGFSILPQVTVTKLPEFEQESAINYSLGFNLWVSDTTLIQFAPAYVVGDDFETVNVTVGVGVAY